MPQREILWGLTSLNKAKTSAKNDEEQLKIRRQSYAVPPPPMESGHPFSSDISNSRRYADLSEDLLLSLESLKDTTARVLPFWNEETVPQINGGKQVLIATIAAPLGASPHIWEALKRPHWWAFPLSMNWTST